MSKRNLSISLLVLVAAVAGGLIQNGFAAREAGPVTGPELVATYDQLATAILGTKNAETAVVKAILADAYRLATASLDAAEKAAAAADTAAAEMHIENAAAAVVLLANEGDKAVAGVRNRLLEGGHHHHATPEIAAKYDPGFVQVTKEMKQALIAEAGAIGRLNVKAAPPTPAEIAAEAERLAGLYKKTLE